jgi:hypothetical protein
MKKLLKLPLRLKLVQHSGQTVLNVEFEIVSLDGTRVHNIAQYTFKREANSAAAEMVLIVWQGSAYKELRASPPNRRFGVDIGNYAK